MTRFLAAFFLVELFTTLAFGHYPAPADANQPAPLSITGPTEVKRDKLVRLKAENVDPKAGLVWRVYPRGKADRATTSDDRFEFAAPPGVYEVELLVVTVDKDGQVRVSEDLHTVTIGGDSGGTDPPTKPPTDPPTDPTPTGKLYIAVVRPDGPALPAFTRIMSDPAWDQIRDKGHVVKDFTLTEAKSHNLDIGSSLPFVSVYRMLPGDNLRRAKEPVPLPSTSAGILQLIEGL